MRLPLQKYESPLEATAFAVATCGFTAKKVSVGTKFFLKSVKAQQEICFICIFETVLVWCNMFTHDRGAEGKKNSNPPPKHFTFLLSFLLTYKPQPMKINIFFSKISGTTGFRPTIFLCPQRSPRRPTHR